MGKLAVFCILFLSISAHAEPVAETGSAAGAIEEFLYRTGLYRCAELPRIVVSEDLISECSPELQHPNEEYFIRISQTYLCSHLDGLTLTVRQGDLTGRFYVATSLDRRSFPGPRVFEPLNTHCPLSSARSCS